MKNARAIEMILLKTFQLSRIMRAFVFCFFVFALTACSKKELLSGVDIRQSIEVLVVLHRAGITAERELIGGSDTYRITASADEYEPALEVLHEYGFPRASMNDLETLTRQNAFSPQSPAMMELRRDVTLSLQVEKLLLALPGVVDVRAVVRSDNAESSYGRFEQKQPAQATVVLRYISDGNDTPLSEEQVKRIVLQAVSGLDEAHVSVSLHRVLSGIVQGQATSNTNLITIKPFRFHVLASDLKLAQKQLMGAVIILLLIGGIIGTLLLMASRVIARKTPIAPQREQLPQGVIVDANPSKLISRKPTLMINTKDLNLDE